jgi:hypothetical protein
MARIIFVGCLALMVAGVANAAMALPRYTSVQASSSSISAALALNFARGQAAALCQSRFRGILVGIAHSSVIKMGTMYNASIWARCQIPG